MAAVGLTLAAVGAGVVTEDAVEGVVVFGTVAESCTLTTI